MWYHDTDPAVTLGKTEPMPCLRLTLSASASRSGAAGSACWLICSCTRGERSAWTAPSASPRGCKLMAGAAHGAGGPSRSSGGPMRIIARRDAVSGLHASAGRQGCALARTPDHPFYTVRKEAVVVLNPEVTLRPAPQKRGLSKGFAKRYAREGRSTHHPKITLRSPGRARYVHRQDASLAPCSFAGP